jgi:outer membrane lipoprotein-sorting protein
MVARLIFLVLVMTAYSMQAQSFDERMTALREEYKSLEHVHIRMSIRVYENAQGVDPLYKEEADIKRDDNNFSYAVGSTEMLMNGKYIVVVDKESKEIMCSPRTLKLEEDMYDDPFSQNLDSILTANGKPTLVGTKEGIMQYQMKHQDGMIVETNMFFNSNANTLQRIEYTYKDQHFVVIEFLKFEKQVQFDDYVFNERKYFNKSKGGKMIPSDEYAGYELQWSDGRK